MSAKPGTPITRKEMYLDVMTGGSSSLPKPITLEEMYLAKIAGMTVDLPTPIFIKHKYLAKIAGMTVNVPTYTTGLPRIYAYLAKAAGQDVDVPQPTTREEMYWFDYVGGQPAPSEREYTGAVPVTFTANGQPLLDYLITGNTVQSGTPTPENPIMPQGTGERTGNLFDGSIEQGTLNENAAIGTSYNNTKSIPTAAINSYRVRVTNPIYIDRELTFSIDFNSYQMYVLFFDENQKYTGSQSSSWRNSPLTLSGEYMGKYIGLVVKSKQSGNVPISPTDDIKLMLNTGSTALPYEPYGIKIPISSANTTTPVYLGEVETTRKVKKVVLDGTEAFYASGSWGKTNTAVYYTALPNAMNLSTNVAYTKCSHYVGASRNYIYDNDIECSGMTGSNSLTFRVNRQYAGTKEDFLAYLAAQYAAGTPVTIWYVLAEPETAIVNEPLMKIGDYTDTLSMAQAGVQIPTVKGENTLNVLTTAKPSEVYIKYKGEPVAGSQTSSQSSDYAPTEVSGQSESIDDINNGLIGKEEETE